MQTVPRDPLGVSDDEIRRMERMSTVLVPADRFPDEDEAKVDANGKLKKTTISCSNEGTAITRKGKVIFRRSPPDFSNLDLIAL
jgi:calcium permeable stress-gated cation channel